MKKFLSSIPNFLTFVNLCLGIIAILLTVQSDGNIYNHVYASLLIMIAAIIDRYDGIFARFFNATSDIGKELDSLSDLISFGVAPIIIAWKICFSTLGLPGYLLSIIYPMAGAYRLARFNARAFEKKYTGMPITIAGAFLTVDNLFNAFSFIRADNYLPVAHRIITAVLIILFSFLMVSKINIKKV